MLAAVADTHTVIWYLFGSSRLSETAKNAIDRAAARGDYVGVSAISLAEMVYPIEKQRIAPQTLERLVNTLANPDEVLTEIPLDSPIVSAMARIPRTQVPDLPDRIVAATALHFGVPVISRDSTIRATDLHTIW